MLTAFHVPPAILVGAGTSDQLLPQVRRLALERVLLVTDPGVRRLGYVEPLAAALHSGGVQVEVFDRVQADPTVANVEAGLDAFKRFRADGLVAVGGGSPIDAAKAISILSTNPAPLSLYEGYRRVPRAGAPLVAVPTTAGTGSEATQVTVITDEARGVKMMLLDPHLLARVALVDYRFSLSMPPPLTAAVGIDTLTHGIEAYVSAKANPFTDPLALACVSLVSQHLTTAVRQAHNECARAGMMLAACQGGMAFANSSVCLVHGMSRPIGALFHVPHGLSNAVLLPTVTRYSVPGAIDRYATLARTWGCASDADAPPAAANALVQAIEQLIAQLGIPRLRDCLGVPRAKFDESLPKMAADALASGSPANNPRVPTAEEVIHLYQSAW